VISACSCQLMVSQDVLKSEMVDASIQVGSITSSITEKVGKTSTKREPERPAGRAEA
jgi:hypothetical protein